MIEQSSTPWISIIVPTRNRQASLEVCIDSLLRQTVDRSNYEIIIVLNEKSRKILFIFIIYLGGGGQYIPNSGLSYIAAAWRTPLL